MQQEEDGVKVHFGEKVVVEAEAEVLTNDIPVMSKKATRVASNVTIVRSMGM